MNYVRMISRASRALVEEIVRTGGNRAEAWVCAAECVLPFVSRERALLGCDSARGLDSERGRVRHAAERLHATSRRRFADGR